MTDNVSAITPSGAFQYNPNIGINPYSDFDYIDMDNSLYPMTGSIFGAMPMFGGYGNLGTNQTFFDNMKQQQQFYNQYYIDQQKMQRNADLQINGAMESIAEHAANLKDKIRQNEQDQVMEAYNKLVNTVRSAYGEGSEEEINSRAMRLYQQFSGKDLVEDLRENSHCSALQGYLQTLTLGTYCRSSAEDNIAKITNQSVPTGEKTAQNLGRLAGIGTIGTGAYYAVKGLSGKTGAIAQAVTKVCKGKAGIVGLAAAGIAALLTFITGKVTT